MKKIIFVSAICFLGIGAFAQTTTPTTVDTKQQDMKDLRTDIRHKRQDEHQKSADVKDGNTVAAKSARHDIKVENKDIKTDANAARAKGVKHPIRRAHRQIHRQNHR